MRSAGPYSIADRLARSAATAQHSPASRDLPCARGPRKKRGTSGTGERREPRKSLSLSLDVDYFQIRML
jgi:hypothetical protein